MMTLQSKTARNACKLSNEKLREARLDFPVNLDSTLNHCVMKRPLLLGALLWLQHCVVSSAESIDPLTYNGGCALVWHCTRITVQLDALCIAL